MTRKSGYALLAALVAVIALVCTTIVVGTGRSGTTTMDAAGPHSSAPAQADVPAAPADSGTWVATWAAAPAAAEPGAPHGYPDLSIRNVVHASVGGAAARVELSNLFGTMPITFTHVTLGVAGGPDEADAVTGELVALAFGGRSAVTLAAGRSVVSDPVRLHVPAAADLLITTYTPYAAGPVTYHPHAREISYVARGDHTDDTAGFAFTGQTPYWRYVTGVDVFTDQAKGCVVALGDSITDGVTSTVGADHRWPDFLAQRLRDAKNGPRLGVVDEGISGNRLLRDAAPEASWDGPSTLARLQRDALDRAGVKTLFVDIGINDIQEPPNELNADVIIAGLREITHEAHEHGIRVVGSTLTPFGGHSSWTPDLEGVRERVNAAIRSGRVYDSYVDFDRALRDPAQPDRLLPAYDSGDHLHPDDAGFRAMADAIPLGILNGPAPASL
jgi:lysophospholipase L1-like esterase